MPTPTFDLTYEDYLTYGNYGQNNSEGSPQPLSEDQWDSMDPATRWNMVGQRIVITPDDSRYEALNTTARAEEGRNIVVSFGDPAYRPDWINDWDRIVRGDGWHALSQDNFSPDWSREQETGSRRMRQRATIAAGALLTGGMAYGALAGGAGLAAEGAAGIGAGATGAGALDLGAAGAAAGTAAPSFGSVVGGSSSTAASPGIVGSITNGLSQVGDWYSGLSPAARMVVNQGISSGAQALSGAAAQRSAQQAAEEREERERQDRVRRGSIPAFVNPYTPRPAGIIGSAFTPRPGGG